MGGGGVQNAFVPPIILGQPPHFSVYRLGFPCRGEIPTMVECTVLECRHGEEGTRWRTPALPEWDVIEMLKLHIADDHGNQVVGLVMIPMMVGKRFTSMRYHAQ